MSSAYPLTRDGMLASLKSRKSKPLRWYVAGRTVRVRDRMQTYEYTLTFDAGKSLRHGGFVDGAPIRYPDFRPRYTPQQMLRLGVFEGKYCNDQIFELPREWFLFRGSLNPRLSPERADAKCNRFGVKSRMSLVHWKKKGWAPLAEDDKDIRGFFQWYMRYWLGRRQPSVDAIQIKRWKAFNRHHAQYVKNTRGKGKNKHPRRRQALLQWSYEALS